MKVDILCSDRYEAQKLASLIFIKEGKETYIRSILNVVENELVISLKDGSAHSVLLRDTENVEKFADFVQSVFDGDHVLASTKVVGDVVEIVKEVYRAKMA